RGAPHAFQHVIRIDQLYRGGAEYALELTESIHLARKRHNPGMNNSAHHKNVITESGQGVADSRAAAKPRNSRAQRPRFSRMSAPRTKFYDKTTSSRFYATRSLGRNESLKRDHTQ